MSEQPKDYGPAFPAWVNDPKWGVSPQGGMSLRDYFAAAALTGERANAFIHKNMKETGVPSDEVPGGMARHCYQLADAMLAERRRSE
jgi:hypothetical protein